MLVIGKTIKSMKTTKIKRINKKELYKKNEIQL